MGFCGCSSMGLFLYMKFFLTKHVNSFTFKCHSLTMDINMLLLRTQTQEHGVETRCRAFVLLDCTSFTLSLVPRPTHRDDGPRFDWLSKVKPLQDRCFLKTDLYPMAGMKEGRASFFTAISIKPAMHG